MKKKTSLGIKTAAILGSALAAIYGVEKVSDFDSNSLSDDNSTQVKAGAKKPMPVLKLNLNNPDDSKFVASHQSHASHRSHRSHYSHRSFAG